MLRRAAAYAAPALLTLGIVTGLAAFEIQRLAPDPIRTKLADLGIHVGTNRDGFVEAQPYRFEPDNLPSAARFLENLSVVSLDLSFTKIVSLEPLKALSGLRQLDLSYTPVDNLEPLNELTALLQLDLSNTPVANLEPLRELTALRQLDLSNTKVANLEPLKELTTLRHLDLSYTPVTNLEPLKELTALQTLHLSNTPVTNLEPLQALPALHQLFLRNPYLPVSEMDSEIDRVKQYREQNGLPAIIFW